MKHILVQDDLALQDLARADAQHLTAKYEYILLTPLLARLLASMYRNPPSAAGPEVRDGEPLSHDDIERCHQIYARISELMREFDILSRPARRALVRVVDIRSLDARRDIIASFIALASRLPRAEPISHASALLHNFVASLSDFLLLHLNRVPELVGLHDHQSYRPFIDEVLARTGWSFPPEEVAAACAMAMKDGAHKRASSCSLRLTRVERAEAKAWREQHGFT